jgi:hypothetical protein
VRYALNRLWNPRTEKGLLATLRKGDAVKLVADILSESDKFFENVEVACEEISKRGQSDGGSFGSRGRSPHQGKQRAWTELRIRRAELVKDNVTLPIQRLREAVSELVKLSEDKDIGQELIECNRRLGELKVEVAEFLSQQAGDHVYWVERGGKAHRNLSLNAAPIDVADYLRRRLFESDTSIVMTSATLATVGQASRLSPSKKEFQPFRSCRLIPRRRLAKPDDISRIGGRMAAHILSPSALEIPFLRTDSPSGTLNCANGCGVIPNREPPIWNWNTPSGSRKGFIAGWMILWANAGCANRKFQPSSKKRCDFSTVSVIGLAISPSCQITFMSWCDRWAKIRFRKFFILGNHSPPSK